MAHKLVLVINCGSSSLKFAILDATTGTQYISGLAECFYLKDARIQWKNAGVKQEAALPEYAAHREALNFIVNHILHENPELSNQLIAIGHRVVHGGERFTHSTLIDNDVLAGIEAAIPFAPLHNPAHIIGIHESWRAFPHLKDKNVAVFDTAFHQSLPEEAYLYALPYALYAEHGIRRYGAHGTSHRFVSEQAAILLKKPLNDLNIISCHLGNGSSVTAIRGGLSVDTSMGLTPLEGLVMGTRSGDLDPAIIFYLHDKLDLSLEQINNLLTKKSGLLGLTEVTSDCRYLEDNYSNELAAKRAMDVLCHRLAKYIGAYSTLMEGRLDAVVFTGGIGENSALVRQITLDKLRILGLIIDKDRNLATRFGKTGIITDDNSLPAWVIPTNEEWVIALDAAQLI